MEKRTFLFTVFCFTFLPVFLLFGQANDIWERFEESQRLSMVLKMTDQVLLTKIAKNDVYDRVRETAVKRITDESVLKEIVRDEFVEYLRFAAAARIPDPEFFKSSTTVYAEPHSSIRGIAIC